MQSLSQVERVSPARLELCCPLARKKLLQDSQPDCYSQQSAVTHIGVGFPQPDLLTHIAVGFPQAIPGRAGTALGLFKSSTLLIQARTPPRWVSPGWTGLVAAPLIGGWKGLTLTDPNRVTRDRHLGWLKKAELLFIVSVQGQSKAFSLSQPHTV